MEHIAKHEFYVGIDSDGTAFDSMTAKHTRAFIPCMIAEWGLQAISEHVYRIAEHINLHASTRGVNRFPGLVLTFDALSELPDVPFDIGDYTSLREFCDSNFPMSNAGLDAYIEKHPDPFLTKVRHWSGEADILFAKEAAKLPPFKNVEPALRSMHPYADLSIISAASKKGLIDDWSRAGILSYMTSVAGQEEGSKAEQLTAAIADQYDKSKCLMLGDGIGDYKAAKSAGILFFPILPSREEESWKRLQEEVFPLFLKGGYAGKAEEELCNEFFDILDPEGTKQ